MLSHLSGILCFLLLVVIMSAVGAYDPGSWRAETPDTVCIYSLRAVSAQSFLKDSGESRFSTG